MLVSGWTDKEGNHYSTLTNSSVSFGNLYRWALIFSVSWEIGNLFDCSMFGTFPRSRSTINNESVSSVYLWLFWNQTNVPIDLLPSQHQQNTPFQMKIASKRGGGFPLVFGLTDQWISARFLPRTCAPFPRSCAPDNHIIRGPRKHQQQRLVSYVDGDSFRNAPPQSHHLILSRSQVTALVAPVAPARWSRY